MLRLAVAIVRLQEMLSESEAVRAELESRLQGEIRKADELNAEIDARKMDRCAFLNKPAEERDEWRE